jgi:UDP-N-acetylmuramate dehydrogenase
LGGRARYFVDCSSEAEIRGVLEQAAVRRVPVHVLGGGSNVVFRDSGFPGLVLRITVGGIGFRDATAPEVTAGAGADWDALVRGAVERGWAGIECLSGIPGTVGGTPIQNVGAYGQEIAETLTSVTCLDRVTLERRTFGAAECEFGYRESRFKRRDRGRYLVLEVTLRLARDAAPAIRYPELQSAVAQTASLQALPPAAAVRVVRETVLSLLSAAAFAALERRWLSGGETAAIPSYPAEGAIKVPAAWLVERAGFPKGHRRGGAGVSSRHALALVNLGGTSAELLALAEAIRDGVAARFGIRLEYEPEVVG